jgi:hypothetical protein
MGGQSPGEVWMTTLDAFLNVRYGRRVRRPIALLLVFGACLGLGATAIAQGGSDDLSIDLTRGCLDGTRVTVHLDPGSGQTLSPVHVRLGDSEVVHLDGVTGDATITVRVPSKRGRLSVSGLAVGRESSGGRTFSATRDYRPCSPEPSPQATPRRSGRPEPTLSGGGEG